MEKFSKQNLSLIRAKINAALKGVSEELGCKMELGNISFEEHQFTVKLTVTNNSHQATAQLIPSWVPVGKTIEFNGKQFIITGYNARKNKYPIIATELRSNKSYILPKRAVIKAQ